MVDKYVFDVLSLVHHRHGIGSLRSGGQTGADEAGIKAGLQLFIPCTALLPAGYMVRTALGRDIRQTESATRSRLTGATEPI